MKAFIGKRLVSLLLALVMVLGLVPVVATPEAEAATLDWQTVKSAVQGLGYPVATRVTSLPGDMSGLWIVANYHQRENDTSNQKYILNPDGPNSWGPPDFANNHSGYESYPVNKLSGNKLDIPHSKYYIRITGSPSSMQLRDYRGLYWDHIYGNAGTWGNFQLSTWAGVYYKAEAVGDTYRVRRIGAEDIVVYMNGYTYRVALTGKLALNTHPQYQLEFYKVSEEVLGLRDVLQEALKYVVDNANGRFDPAVYQAYLEFIHGAAVTYNQKFREAAYNAVDSAALNQLKTDVWDQMAKMKLYDSSQEFIDIPIEVLDFRGDGFLFEGRGAWESVYSLSCKAPDINDSRYPGKYVQVGNYANVEDGFHIEELVEDKLVNGRVIYTQKTVDYIAYHMYQKTSLITPFAGNKMNMAIYNKVTDGTLRYDSVNGYANTLTRCVPAQIGGEMHWNAIETYHDLAYFMLSHMWTETTDIIGQDTLKDNTTLNNYTFNMPIPELSKLRLFKNGSSYSYNSSNNSSCYNYGFIFNDSTNRDRGDPWFRPLSNKGFESPSLYGNATEPPYTNGEQYKPEINYCFSLHAYGSFVYTQDSELYFNFGGDDDVYFFINGELVCDLGGIHGHIADEVRLNDLVKNGTLSLKEGQICRFDMFHMDRHTSGINMNFSTNMKIMDESVITEKTQYDPTTGQELPDGAALNTGADVGYTFGLINRRSGPLKDVRFADSKLGVTLDGSQGRVELNGQSASELTLTYTTCDIESKELYTGTPTVCQSYAAIKNLIETATNAYTTAQPLAAGSYVYTPRDETELREILGWGIPANCKLSIRGFKHTLTAGEFINSLSTLCTPMEYDSVQNVAKALDSVSGAASCRSVGMDLTGVTGKPYRVVMDYGKPIEINLRKVDEFIAGDSGISFQYVGSTFDGRHGLVRAKEPLNLIFKTGGEDYDRELGVFHMNNANILRYSPKGFMDRVDPFYAVYKVTMASQPNFVAYLFNAVEFLPAHTVYYEAEDFKSEISLDKKTTDKDTGAVTLQNTWAEENLEKEGTSGGTVQDHVPLGEAVYIPDYRNHPEVLFFGFDNTPEDRERYTNAANKYGNRNYDDATNTAANWSYPTARVAKVSINNEKGELTIHTKGSYADTDFPDARIDTGAKMADKPLTYNPPDNAVFQVRFKLKNFHQGASDKESKTALINMQYQTQALINDNDKWATGSNWENYAENIHTDLFNGEHYVVLTQDTWGSFYNSEIKKLRFAFNWIEPKNGVPAEATIDYIYIGPRELAPVETTYGWDGSYRTDAKLSDGESLFVRGNGVRLPSQTPETAKNYTEMRFTFTGTGFDLISRTGKEQGACRVEVYKESDLTKAVKTLTVQNKGELELYQIPVVSVRDLEHGTYVVSVMVNDKTDSSLDFLKRGNEFYLDAIRIFDPIDVSAGPDATEENAVSAYAAYCADEEAYPVIQEVRDILLSATDFQALDGSTVGAVYVDMVTVPTETVPATDANGDPTGGYETVKPDLDVNNHITGTIATYEKVGPKNEVYLGPGQKIAFKLVVKSAELPKRVDVACKAVEGGSTSLSVVAVKNASDKFHGIRTPITSATAQYYSLTIWDKRFEAGTDDANNPIHYIYVIIENIATSGVLSVTDVKVAYDCKPTLPAGVQPAAYSPEPAKRNATVELPADYFVDFVVDNHIMDVINSYIEGQKETVCAHEPGDWVVETPALPGQEGMRVSYCLHCGVPCKSETIAPISKLSFVGATVSLQTDLAIHYKVNESFFAEGGYTDPYVVVVDNGMETVIRDYTVSGGRLSFDYKNIAPHRTGDTVTATLYAYHDGKLYSSESKDYSIADYCYNMLNRYGDNSEYTSLNTLLVDLLLYGAESQKYTKYHTDNLCTARLTEKQLAWGTELHRELVSCRDQAYKVIDNPTVEWKGAGLNLQESVAVRFKIVADSYEGLEVKITMDGRTQTIHAEDFDYRKDGAYVHFNGLNAAQLSSPIYVTAYRDGVQVSNTICYSVESYAYAKQNDTTVPYLASLVKRMMCYGDSARAYIGK